MVLHRPVELAALIGHVSYRTTIVKWLIQFLGPPTHPSTGGRPETYWEYLMDGGPGAGKK